MINTKTKKDINAVYGKVTKQGNGAHVLVPKDWLNQEVQVKLLKVAQEEAFDKELKRHRIRSIR